MWEEVKVAKDAENDEESVASEASGEVEAEGEPGEEDQDSSQMLETVMKVADLLVNY
jgi:hypothetical protein